MLLSSNPLISLLFIIKAPGMKFQLLLDLITFFPYIISQRSVAELMSRSNQTGKVSDQKTYDQVNRVCSQYSIQQRSEGHHGGLSGVLVNDQKAKNGLEPILQQSKVKQLQTLCTNLSQSNNKLAVKIARLEIQLESKSNISQSSVDNISEDDLSPNDSYSQINSQFTEMEHFIKQYRQSLTQLQTTTIKTIKEQQKAIEQYQQQVNGLSQRIENLERQNQEAKKFTRQLEARNLGLVLEIGDLHDHVKQLKEKVKKNNQVYNKNSCYYRLYNQGDISTEIHQLQSIIDRLVKELEYEKNIKKKMNGELQRMAKELMKSEEQIMEKNQRLYNLEMRLLKNIRSQKNMRIGKKIQTANNQEKTLATLRIQKFKQNQEINHNRNGTQENQENYMTFRNFTLLEMINQQLCETITLNERKAIAMKILELYQHKIQKGDFIAIIPETIKIQNFNHQRPQLIEIGVSYTQEAIEDPQKTVGNLIWNMAFIFQNVFGCTSGGCFTDVIELISEMVDKQGNNTVEDLKLLKGELSKIP